MAKKSTFSQEVEVLSRLTSIEQFLPVMKTHEQAAAAAEAKLKRMVDDYQEKRFELFKKRLQKQKKGWCTVEGHLVPLHILRFLFKTGKRWRRSHESDYLRGYNELHRACPNCRRKELEMHGYSDGSAYSYVYPAKKNGKGFLFKKFGNWMPLPDRAEKQEIPKYTLSKALAAELGIPKAIDYRGCPFKILIED